MLSPSIRTTSLAIFTLATLAPLASAHSWVEEFQVISSNGSYTGARGYSRGYVPRTDPTYNGFSMMWMLPSLEARYADGTTRNHINSSDLVCHPAQRTSSQTTGYPRLQVASGDYVAMKYLENGHVTLPWNITGKPPGGGTVFVFGTTQPFDDQKIADVMAWNQAGTGGNGKGFLMTAQNFDDGRCHQINCGSISEQRQILKPNHVAGQPTSTVESWCESDIQIPENITSGTLTTYWIWDFRTESNMDCNNPAGKDEYYTTCADFDIVPESVMRDAAILSQSISPAESNPQSIAVRNYKSRTAYTPLPSPLVMNNKHAGATPTINSAFASACSAHVSVISVNSLALWPEVYVPNSCSVVSSFGTAAASAAMRVFDSAAESYTSGSSSAWSAAFAAAGMRVPTRTPWSVYPSTTGKSAPRPTSHATTLAETSALVTVSSPSAATPASAPGYQSVVTVTTVVLSTITLQPGETPPSAPAYSAPSSLSTTTPSTSLSTSAPLPSSSSSSPSSPSPSSPSASTYSHPTPSTSTSSPSTAVITPSESETAGQIQTLSTLIPSSTGTGTGSPPSIPTVASNGTVYQRFHARAFARLG